jgi:DNA-binding NarL/FixJ family response regulator
VKRTTPADPSVASGFSAPFYPPTGAAVNDRSVRIVIADDHPLLRHGLAALLALYADMDVCALAGSGRETVEQFRLHRPKVVLADLRLSSIEGDTAIKVIHDECPDACIIAMTTLPDKQVIARAIADGAAACWLKTSPLTDLIAIIRALDVTNGSPGLVHTNRPAGSEHLI